MKDDCWLERTKNVLQIYKLLVAFVLLVGFLLKMSSNYDSDDSGVAMIQASNKSPQM